MGMRLDHTVYTLMNVSLSLQDCHKSRGKNRKLILPTFGNGFLPSSKYNILF